MRVNSHVLANDSLELADTSSPSQTLASFMTASDVLIDHWRSVSYSARVFMHSEKPKAKRFTPITSICCATYTVN